MGVLGGHAPMIVALKGGVISVRENGQETERMFVRGGFADIGPSRVTILADDARPVAEISRAEAERFIVEAERDYQAAADDTPEKRDAAMDRLLAMRLMKEAAQAA
jgi:F-type H+-transporting ATPase subunit epsilon